MLRIGVKVANKVTRPVQAEVTHKQFVSQDGAGKKTFSPSTGIKRLCLFEQQEHKMELPDGRLIAVEAVLTFLEEVLPQGASGRLEPIDPRDEIILPDGSTAPVVYVSAPYDPKKKRGFVVQVWLGVKRSQGAGQGV